MRVLAWSWLVPCQVPIKMMNASIRCLYHHTTTSDRIPSESKFLNLYSKRRHYFFTYRNPNPYVQLRTQNQGFGNGFYARFFFFFPIIQCVMCVRELEELLRVYYIESLDCQTLYLEFKKFITDANFNYPSLVFST